MALEEATGIRAGALAPVYLAPMWKHSSIVCRRARPRRLPRPHPRGPCRRHRSRQRKRNHRRREGHRGPGGRDQERPDSRRRHRRRDPKARGRGHEGHRPRGPHRDSGTPRRSLSFRVGRDRHARGLGPFLSQGEERPGRRRRRRETGDGSRRAATGSRAAGGTKESSRSVGTSTPRTSTRSRRRTRSGSPTPWATTESPTASR